MRAVEPGSAVRRAHLPDLLAKKSRSTVSCPIFACSFSISRSRYGLGIPADPGVKGAGRLLLQLLLPGVNLVRVNFVTLRQVCHRRLLPQRLQGDPRLQPRLDLASRLLHHPLRLARRNGARPNYGPGPKSGVHFRDPRPSILLMRPAANRAE